MKERMNVCSFVAALLIIYKIKVLQATSTGLVLLMSINICILYCVTGERTQWNDGITSSKSILVVSCFM